MGISVQASGIKVEKNKFYLVNLNADPSLNELLVYYLKERTLVGARGAPVPQDIQLSGLGIIIIKNLQPLLLCQLFKHEIPDTNRYIPSQITASFKKSFDMFAILFWISLSTSKCKALSINLPNISNNKVFCVLELYIYVTVISLL